MPEKQGKSYLANAQQQTYHHFRVVFPALLHISRTQFWREKYLGNIARLWCFQRHFIGLGIRSRLRMLVYELSISKSCPKAREASTFRTQVQKKKKKVQGLSKGTWKIYHEARTHPRRALELSDIPNLTISSILTLLFCFFFSICMHRGGQRRVFLFFKWGWSKSRKACLVLSNPFFIFLYFSSCLPAVMIIPSGICTSVLEQGKSSKHKAVGNTLSEPTTHITSRLWGARIGDVDLKCEKAGSNSVLGIRIQLQD